MRRSGAWLATALVALLLTMGAFVPWAPYPWLERLPVFSSLRIPSRYSLLVIVALLIGASYGLKELLRRLDKAAPTVRVLGVTAAAALLIWGCGTMLWHNGRIVDARVCSEPAVKPVVADSFRWVTGNPWEMWRTTRQGLGTLRCMEAAGIPSSKSIWTGPSPQADLSSTTAGKVEVRLWSPQRWELSAELSEPAIVRLNQNFRPGFVTSHGEVVSTKGLVGVSLQPGRYELSVRFRPWEGLVGIGLSILAWGSLLLWGVGELRRRGG